MKFGSLLACNLEPLQRLLTLLTSIVDSLNPYHLATSLLVLAPSRNDFDILI